MSKIIRRRDGVTKEITKVYIPNKGAGHDFSDAKRFGKLVYVTRGIINPFSVGIMARSWHEVLKDSSPNDYIIVTSLASLLAIGTAYFMTKHGKINLLQFTSNQKYVQRTILYKEIIGG